jgi:hypothetical protein
MAASDPIALSKKTSANRVNLVGPAGLEPATNALWADCLLANILMFNDSNIP